MALLNLPGSLRTRAISASLHLYTQLLVALFAVQAAAEGALPSYRLSFLRSEKGWRVSLFGQNSFKGVLV